MGLKLKKVTKKFGEHTAVDQLSITIPPGEIFGFLGANGSGKTTTFRMILGLLPMTNGEICWNERPMNDFFRSQIGYLPEERGLYPKLKVKEQLLYLAKLRGMNKQRAQKEIMKWLEAFHIVDYARKRVEELSKGNQQKIQFIASVIHQPTLLILDEPFTGLDPVNVELLKKAMIDIQKSGTTIVFSSHRMEHVEQLCEHVCILHHGRPIVQGELKQIKQAYGKKNVIIHTDMNTSFLKNYPGVSKVVQTPEGVQLQVTGEAVSNQLLKDVVQKGIIRKFVIEEPSLNDIFIEKVGSSYE